MKYVVRSFIVVLMLFCVSTISIAYFDIEVSTTRNHHISQGFTYLGQSDWGKGDTTRSWLNDTYMYLPPGEIIFILFCIVSFLAFIGAVIGYVLSKKVRGKHMAIGSAVYWTISLINLYFTTFYIHDYIARTVNAIILFSMFLVPFLNLAYIVGKYRLTAIKVFITMFLSTFITLLVTFTTFIGRWDSFYYITSLLYSLVIAVFFVSVYELYKLEKKRYGKTRQM